VNKKILLIGAGGHCKSVLDSVLNKNDFSEIEIIDKNKNIGKKVLGKAVTGCDEDLIKFFNKGYIYAFITVGSIKNFKPRIKLFKKILNIGFEIPNIIDVTAKISKYIKMERGIFIGKNAVINTDVYLEEGVIVNTGSIIEHDCCIGEFSHIAPGAVLCGEVKVGKNTHIGANSVIKQQIQIGNNSIIGMGSVVLSDIEDNVIAYGNPCKVVRKQ
jgi:sugar O-acyltransferase (sialic acid O-acetyltransferase NeuD family)